MTHWQQIEGYLGYLISEDGRVWSDYSHKELAQHPDHKGYLRVRLKKDGRVRNLRVHRLVAQHWLEGEPSETVNHKDTNKRNNHWDNLEWMTSLANISHAQQHGRFAKKLTALDITCLRTMRDDGYLLREIASLYGISEPVVHRHLAKTS